MTPKSVGLRFNATPEMAAQLQTLAEQDDVSVAHVIRRAVRAYLLPLQIATIAPKEPQP